MLLTLLVSVCSLSYEVAPRSDSEDSEEEEEEVGASYRLCLNSKDTS